MAKPRSRGFEALLLVAIVAIAVPVIVLGSVALRPRSAAPLPQSSASTNARSSASTEAQICAGCWGDGSPRPRVAGKAVMEDGAQVLKVGLAAGYYAPSDFTVEAGLPVTVIFSGRAEGCLAEPEFPELGVKGDFSSGTATLDLGRLRPGTYSLTCSMGVDMGTITAE